MTDQLEQDLTALFARRAAEAEVPPMPPELFTGADRPGPGRRAAIALVAAAAVAAVAVPVGLSLRDGDDVQPSPAPAPTAPHGDVASIEVPYLRDGELHVGDVSVPTDATSIAVGADGEHVYVGTPAGRWHQLVGDRLERAPYLDGSRSVFVSPDGDWVVALVGDGQTTFAYLSTERPSDVSTYTRSKPAGEDPWVVGFDDDDRIFFQDGGQTVLTPSTGDEVTLDTGGRQVVALTPGGPLVVGPEGAAVVRVDGDRLVDRYEVPVSTAGVWDDAGRLASINGPGLRVSLPQIGAEPVVLMADTQGTVQPLGWSNGMVVAQEWWPGAGSRVVLVDPESGEVTELFTVPEGDDSVVFPHVSGTGAL